MKDCTFEIKSDTDLTENNGRYIRGHYDMVIFNPDFIKNNCYNLIKAQDYTNFKSVFPDKLPESAILYGIEFMFKRDPIKYSRGTEEEKGIDLFIKQIIQDSDKLKASFDYKFMKTIKMIVFMKGSDREIQELIKNKINKLSINEIMLCFAE